MGGLSALSALGINLGPLAAALPGYIAPLRLYPFSLLIFILASNLVQLRPLAEVAVDATTILRPLYAIVLF